MSNTVTIKFRAKRAEFSGGEGYKVPTLTASHVTVSERDTLGTLSMQSLNNPDMTKARLAKFAGLDLPGVVWADGVDSYGFSDTSEWTITPIGNGFMAEVSITRPLSR
jgi:hypothetical protein